MRYLKVPNNALLNVLNVICVIHNISSTPATIFIKASGVVAANKQTEAAHLSQSFLVFVVYSHQNTLNTLEKNSMGTASVIIFYWLGSGIEQHNSSAFGKHFQEKHNADLEITDLTSKFSIRSKGKVFFLIYEKLFICKRKLQLNTQSTLFVS